MMRVIGRNASRINRRLPVSPVAVLLLCVLALSGCAGNDKREAMEQSQQLEKQQLNRTIEALQRSQQASQQVSRQQIDTLNALSDRLAKLEESSQVQQAQLKAISNRIEQLHARKKTAPPKKKATAKPDQVKAAAAVKQPAPMVVNRPKPVQAVASKPVATVDKAAMVEAEKNAYTAAYLALKSGRYEEAATGFNKQLDQFADGEYADQAWYWLGEARLAQGDSDRAFNAFKYVADHYPDSVKHAAALLKLGQISEARNRYQDATSYYNRLIGDHPDSSLAEQARELLGRTASGASGQGQ